MQEEGLQVTGGRAQAAVLHLPDAAECLFPSGTLKARVDGLATHGDVESRLAPHQLPLARS